MANCNTPCGPNYNNTAGSRDIERISFNNIVNLAIIDLASIGITGIKDMLSIDGSPIDGMDVIMQILKTTIDRFEVLNPLGLYVYPYYTAGETYKFEDNFWEFIDGKVDRANMQLVPRAIVAIVGTYLGTLRGVEYKAPYMYNVSYTGQYRTQIIANRPYRMEKNGDKFTDDSMIFYLSENTKEELYLFRLLFLVNLGEYIIRLNENLEHPNMPINTFAGLQNYISQKRSEYEQLQENSFTYYDIYSNC
jgi:hypothetical protein